MGGEADLWNPTFGPYLTSLEPPSVSVLVAEGLPLVRALLRDLLTAWPRVTLVGEVTAADKLLADTRRLQPDQVGLDCALGGLGAVNQQRGPPWSTKPTPSTGRPFGPRRWSWKSMMSSHPRTRAAGNTGWTSAQINSC